MQRPIIHTAHAEPIQNYYIAISGMQNYLAQLDQTPPLPLSYLLPRQWWQQFVEQNSSCMQRSQLRFPALSLQCYVDCFVLEFREGIIEELEHKSNYLKLEKVTISPQPLPQCHWHHVSSDLWQLIKQGTGSQFGVLSLQLADAQEKVDTANVQIQIVFCTKKGSQAYVGFVNEHARVAQVIRAIGNELGFVEVAKSRISFPEVNPEKPYYFQQMERVKIGKAPDTFFLAYNMQCTETKQTEANEKQQEFSFGEAANTGFAQLNDAFDQDSMSRVRVDRTMSTGAETPSFVGSDLGFGQDFRVRELFREKKPEQIQQLKLKAKKIMGGQLIPVCCKNQEELELQLEAIAGELQELTFHKKKIVYKDKQLCME